MATFLRTATARCSAVLCLTALVSAQTQFRTEPLLAASPSALLQTTVAGDFDGDGDVDLFSQPLSITPWSPFVFLRNDGRGRFTNASAGSIPPLTTSPGFGSIGLVAFDMDGDGDLDVFAGDSTGGNPAILLRNVGGAVFVNAVGSLPAGIDGVIFALAEDLDGDGDLDLAVVESIFAGGQQLVLVNNGSGVFTPGPQIATSLASRFSAADIDGDGDVDLAMGQLGGVRVLRNDGALSFTDVTASWLPPLPGSGSLLPLFGDVDVDGLADLVVASSAGPVDYVLLNGGASFGLSGTPLATNGTTIGALADVDDDGDLDLLRAEGLGTVLLAVNAGGGAFVAAPTRMPPLVTAGPVLTVADLDGDADPDLVVGSLLAAGSTFLRNRHRHVDAGPALVGQAWGIDLWSAPGYATLDHLGLLGVGLVRLPQAVAVPGFGGLWLDPSTPLVVAAAVVPAATGVRGFAFAIPPIPALAGIELNVQALLEQAPLPAHFTGFDSVVIQ